jgi:hypothetical protein
LQAAGAHMLNTARIPPTAEMMQRRPPFANSPPKKEGAPPAPAPTVIPETPAPTAESYWTERARREIENMERAAAENRAKFLDRDLAGK